MYFDDKYLCFVESTLERDYAKKLFLDNTPFIKPIDNSELFKIKKEKIVPPGQAFFNLSHRPDFIEFKNEKIVIVEVSGDINSEYEEQLAYKEKDYLNIVKKYSYVLYKKI